jgi:hypothetical protein
LDGPTVSDTETKKHDFRGRTNIVFGVVFIAILLVCFYYNVRAKQALAVAIFGSFFGAGIWLVMVEDILSPSNRNGQKG